MKKIDISTKKYPNTFALVDDEDFERMNKYRWTPLESRNTIYAHRKIFIFKMPALHLLMHREIMRYVGSKLVDHKNHNGLDNQKENLRLCTYTQNCMNRKSHKNTSSIYKGVNFNKPTRKWIASIRVNKILKHLGLFVKEEDAAEAYNKAAKVYFKEYAHLNKIKEVV